MRILTVSYEYPPLGGGGAPMCQGICEAMVAAGHEVDVVTSGMRDLPEREERAGVRIHRVPCVRRHRHYTTTAELFTTLLPAYRRALALQREAPYDVNHCHFVVPSGVVAYALWKRTGLPYVITSHGSDIPGYNPDRFSLAHRVIRPVWSRIVRGARAISTPSHFLANLIQQHLDVPVDVIPYGFDAPRVPPVERGNRILVATRMFERKGVQYLLRALEELDTDWEVLIAGDGPYLPHLREQAAETGVRVTFLGQVSDRELTTLYRTARVFVFPSIRENFPVVLLEAMAAGCAVVTTSAEGCAEVVGDAAITVASGDGTALHAALGTLLDDDARIQELSARARARITRFAWARIVTEYEDLYRRSLLVPALVPV